MRHTNRAPILPARFLGTSGIFRMTSKQEWAEIAYDLAKQLSGGDEASDEAVLGDLYRRREIVRGEVRSRRE